MIQIEVKFPTLDTVFTLEQDFHITIAINEQPTATTIY